MPPHTDILVESFILAKTIVQYTSTCNHGKYLILIYRYINSFHLVNDILTVKNEAIQMQMIRYNPTALTSMHNILVMSMFTTL